MTTWSVEPGPRPSAGSSGPRWRKGHRHVKESSTGTWAARDPPHILVSQEGLKHRRALSRHVAHNDAVKLCKLTENVINPIMQ